MASRNSQEPLKIFTFFSGLTGRPSPSPAIPTSLKSDDMKKKVLIGTGIALGAGLAAAGLFGYFTFRSGDESTPKKRSIKGHKPKKNKNIIDDDKKVKIEEEEEEVEGEEEEEESVRREKIKVPLSYRRYRFARGGFRIRYPSGWCTIEKPQEKIPLMTVHFVNPKTALNGKVQTFVSIESQRILPSSEEYLRKSLEIIGGAGQITNLTKRKRIINGLEFYEVEFSVNYQVIKEELRVYCACTGLNHRNFLFQQLCREQEIDRDVCEKMLSTIQIDPTNDIGSVTYHGEGFSIRLPTVNFEKMNLFETKNVLYMGEKLHDESLFSYIKLDEERNKSISQLEDLIRRNLKKKSSKVREEPVSIASGRAILFTYKKSSSSSSKEEEDTNTHENGTYFIIPFESSNKKCFRLEYFVRNCNNFEKTKILKSIESILYDPEKRRYEPHLFYFNHPAHFGIRYPPTYCCLENTHDEPIVTFENISVTNLFETDVCKKPMIEKILTLDELKKEVLRSINSQNLIGQKFVKINGKDFIEVQYLQRGEFGKELYLLQSVTALNDEYFYIRTTKDNGMFDENELEEVRRIHSSLKLSM